MLDQFIRASLAEDIQDGDHSSLACVPAAARSSAVLLIKESGVLAGMEVAERICTLYDNSLEFSPFLKDGDKVQPGQIAFKLAGSARSILAIERLLLNCMQHMSGVATQTAAYVALIKDTNCTLLDTRKTTPNFRLLEKEAVRIGGGTNHRFGLYDMIMLKDNHIDFAGGIPQAIDRAWQYVQDRQPGLKIEVETRSLDEVGLVLNHGVGKVFRIMLDNFKPTLIREALSMIDGAFETEASGGIHLENLLEFAETGVDYVSVGALIHQARSLDLSLKAV